MLSNQKWGLRGMTGMPSMKTAGLAVCGATVMIWLSAQCWAEANNTLRKREGQDYIASTPDGR